jgi:two-component system capsular synthesis sensor histidine kinase RcsC
MNNYGDSYAAASTETQPQRQTNSPCRILVVDDDVDIRDICVQVLTACRYQADAVADAGAAWKVLRARSYDLLITNHNMPEVTGIELVRILRSQRMTLPIVLMSDILPAQSVIRDSSLQLADALLKPFTMEELLGIVTKILYAVAVGSSTDHSQMTAPSRSNAQI